VIRWLVLTGGASSRLGFDKASSVLAGRSLVDRAQDALVEVDPSASITQVGPERDGGPAAAVASVLVDITEPFVGVLAVDMPLAQPALSAVVARVARSQDSELGSDGVIDAWVPVGSDGRLQWLCAVYRRSSLMRAVQLATAGAGEIAGLPFHHLVATMEVCPVSVDSDVSLLDIDTPQDFNAARGEIEKRD
jgi:molybdopterin-guanine dinucleotide biosynthesis protein A